MANIAKIEDIPNRTIISNVQIYLGFHDAPLRVGYLQIFSIIRVLCQLESQRKGHSMNWTRVV